MICPDCIKPMLPAKEVNMFNREVFIESEKEWDYEHISDEVYECLSCQLEVAIIRRGE